MSLTPFIGMLFITHQLPKGLLVDEAVLLGKDKETEEQQNEKLRQE